MQTQFKCAYQGARGAFSEEAALALLGDGKLLACRRFEEIFDAVRANDAALGVVPIENTLAGSVVASYDLLADRDLTIVGETVRHISHAVIGLPGSSLGVVRRIYSHPVALAQCEGLFVDHPSIEAVPAFDTAGAVEQVIAAGDPTSAAIASARAAKVYGGQVLKRDVQDDPENYTRFLAVARPGEEVPQLNGDAMGTKTSIVFTVANAPGKLYACLGHFAEREVDLSKIESRPLRGRPFEYAFYVDLLGEILDDALDALRDSATSVRVLGHYPIVATESRTAHG